MREECYMCEAVATSREHVPAKCIFPEEKDTGGINYRKNLMTVPSCKKHNSQTSKDDEFLLYVISASITSNNVGINQFFSKVVRSIQKNPALGKSISEINEKILIHDTKPDQWSEAYALSIDKARMDATLDKIARALYFVENRTRFEGTPAIFSGFTLRTDKNINELNDRILSIASAILTSEKEKGENKDVFTYRNSTHEDNHIYELSFYRNTKVVVFFRSPAAAS